MAREFKPSPQQQALFNWITNGTGSCVVEAVAGSGKTTTLIKAIEFMSGDVALVAYNKAIALEFEKRLIEADLMAKSGTAHSFGFQAWRNANSTTRLVVDDRKKWDAITAEVGMPSNLFGFCKKLVSIAKQSGVGFLWEAADYQHWAELVSHYNLEYELADEVNAMNGALEEVTERAIRFAQEALAVGIRLATSIIDFDDMIYQPLLCGCKLYQYDWVLVDEAQDTNASRRELYRRMLRPDGRAIYVGDARQAIYGFTGADHDALDLCAAQHDECTRLPLSVTYRCPQAVAALVKSTVPEFEAAPWNQQGAEITINAGQFQINYIDSKGLTAVDAILCRNTKPLVELAFSLIRRGIPCHVEGREIGAGLARLAQRWRVKQCATLRTRLDEYLQRETAKLIERKQEDKAEALADKVQTLVVIIESLLATATVDELVQHIQRMFGDTEPGKPSYNLTLSTIHKSKGREWTRVFLYREELIPSRFAVQPWQQRQEENLLYVAWTRTLETLIRVRG